MPVLILNYDRVSLAYSPCRAVNLKTSPLSRAIVNCTAELQRLHTRQRK